MRACEGEEEGERKETGWINDESAGRQPRAERVCGYVVEIRSYIGLHTKRDKHTGGRGEAYRINVPEIAIGKQSVYMKEAKS